MEKHYIAETIGNDYKNWLKGDSIIIASQTGSGKSTFILNTLLPHAIERGKHIVYFCNRKILHEQLEVQSDKSLAEFFNVRSNVSQSELPYIHIVTYQYCEQTRSACRFKITPEMPRISRAEAVKKKLTKEYPQTKELGPADIMYYVFDEAHYFISDAMFNANTNFWLDQNFGRGISIYLTATPEPLMFFLKCRENRYWMPYEEVANKVIEKAKTRKALMDHKKIKVHANSQDFDVTVNSLRSVNDSIRMINPYIKPLAWISEAIAELQNPKEKTRVYNHPMHYSYIEATWYFNKYSELINEIVESKSKWLIFVDKEREGIDLAARLSQIGIDSVFLSAKTGRTANTEEHKEFCNIVQKQRFECKVLIATSVLDCGVSISDSNVKNVVIGHSEKTTFIQMLGRCRVRGEQTIKLFIKSFSARQINTLRYDYEKKLQFLIFFKLRNAIGYDRVKEPTQDDDGMRARTKLPAQSLNQLVKNLPRNGSIVIQAASAADPFYGPYARVKNASGLDEILKEYKPSETALIAILYAFYNYREAVEIHREEKDPAFFLKQQLSWIGKHYEPSNWVGLERVRTLIMEVLGNYYLQGLWLSKIEQKQFSIECMEILEKHPMPALKLKDSILKYQKNPNTLPGKKRLNDIFAEVGLPYRIRAKQGAAGDRSTRWQITLVNK